MADGLYSTSGFANGIMQTKKERRETTRHPARLPLGDFIFQAPAVGHACRRGGSMSLSSLQAPQDQRVHRVAARVEHLSS